MLTPDSKRLSEVGSVPNDSQNGYEDPSDHLLRIEHSGKMGDLCRFVYSM